MRQLTRRRGPTAAALVARQKSTPATTLPSAAAASIERTPQKDQLDLSFQDARAAFQSKTTWEVVRGYLVYTLCTSRYLVDNNAMVSS